jgi:hypothetical protein
MASNGYNSIFCKVLIIASISLMTTSLLFSNITPAKIFALGQIAIAQTQPASTSQFPIRNVEFSTSLDKAGDPIQVTIGEGADADCEICQFIKYIPGPVGKAGVAYKSAQTLDLSGAKRVVFFAKGELGGEHLSFIAIGKPSNTSPVLPNIFTNLKFAVISKNVTLTNEWARYQLGLNVTGATGVTDPFGFIVSKVRTQVPSNSTSPQPPLTDANANHVTFFMKGVTFDNNPAVNPIPTVQLSSTNTTNATTTATPTKAATTTTSLNTTSPTNATTTPKTTATPTKAATTTTSLNTTSPTNATTTPKTTATPTKAATTTTSLNTTSPTNATTTPKTTATPTKAAIANTLKGGTSPTTSSTPSSTLTQRNAPLASSTQQRWHDWNGSTTSTTTRSPFTNTTNPNTIPLSSITTTPDTFNPSSPTTGSNVNGRGISTPTSTNQNVISGNNSPSQKQQQQPQAILLPSEQQRQSQSSFSTPNTGQFSHTWQNPTIGLSQKQQQQPQAILLPSQHQNQSSLANTSPYQYPSPSPYQNQYPSPSPYQNQYPSPYQNHYSLPSPYENQYQYQKQQSIANQPPIANAGISQTVTEGTTVTLDGRTSYDPDGGTVVAYSWTQVPSSGGVPVTLIGASTATPTFSAPLLPNGNTAMLIFTLRVMDSDGGAVSSNPSVVYVTLKPNNISGTPASGVGSTIPGFNQQNPQIPPNPGNAIFTPRFH